MTGEELTDSPVQLSRSFNWGVLVIGDEAGEVPTGLDSAGFGANRHSIAIPVRHAQDVDDSDGGPFEVVVYLAMGPADSASTFEAPIEVASGTLAVGDADRFDLFRLSSNRWRVSVHLSPKDDAERVVVRLSAAD